MEITVSTKGEISVTNRGLIIGGRKIYIYENGTVLLLEFIDGGFMTSGTQRGEGIMNKIELKDGTGVEIVEDGLLLKGKIITINAGLRDEEKTIITKNGNGVVIQDKDSIRTYVGTNLEETAPLVHKVRLLKADGSWTVVEKQFKDNSSVRSAPSNNDLSLRLGYLEAEIKTKASQSDLSRQVSTLQTLISGISATVSKLAAKVFGE